MEAQSTAPKLGLALQSAEVSSSDDLDKAFASVVLARSGAVVVLPTRF